MKSTVLLLLVYIIIWDYDFIFKMDINKQWKLLLIFTFRSSFPLTKHKCRHFKRVLEINKKNDFIVMSILNPFKSPHCIFGSFFFLNLFLLIFRDSRREMEKNTDMRAWHQYSSIIWCQYLLKHTLSIFNSPFGCSFHELMAI